MTVTAVVDSKENNLVSVSPTSAVTDENGEARFTIKAKNKNGKAKVYFSIEEWSSWATWEVSVKVRQFYSNCFYLLEFKLKAEMIFCR